MMLILMLLLVKYIARVAVYVSQFGPIAVVPNKHMEANTTTSLI